MTAAVLPTLGVGVVYVPGLEPLLAPGESCVDVIEVEPEVLWQFDPGARTPYELPPRTLERLRRLPQPKLVHSVGFGLGGSRRPRPAFTRALAETARSLGAPWASGHLSFTEAGTDDGAFHTGFLLPPLHTREGARCARETLREVARRLPVPLAVETGVSYLRPRPGEIADGELVARAVEDTDCGILLDLHNVWTNERNGRQTVLRFLEDLPLDRIWELHVGGGFAFEGFWLDAHSGAVPETVLRLAEEVLPALPNVKALVYEIFPTFVPRFGLPAIRNELAALRAIWEGSRRPQAAALRRRTARSLPSVTAPPAASADVPEVWERTLAELVTTGSSEGPLATNLASDPGVELLRRLVWRFRAGAVVQVLDVLTRLLLLHSGADRLEALLDDHFRRTTPRPFASEEAREFIASLRRSHLDIPFLDEVLAYEEARLRALLEDRAQYVRFRFDPRALLEALAEGRIPSAPESGDFELEVSPEADDDL